MNYSFKIYEYDHFGKYWEDRKNGLFMLELNCDIEKWLDEHISEYYDINCDDYYDNPDKCDFMIIEFANEREALTFKLRWLYMTIDIKDFTAYCVDANLAIPFDDIKWITGLKNMIELEKGFIEHAQLRDWCLENCSNKVAFVEKKALLRSETRVTIYCYDEEDAAAVKLRWL